MALNEQKGNMYGFVTHTWNAIKGKCSHDCSYCYMKRWGELKPLRFDEKELKTDLGEGNFIFVGSSTDMFADDVPHEWISKVLEHCKKYPKNTYLFQTKNPFKFLDYKDDFLSNSILGVTIETNRETPSKALTTSERASWMSYEELWRFRKMVTIEPIMDCEVAPLSDMIKEIRPEFVNIGADSGNHKLPEPSPFKVQCLIKELEKFTKVNLKDNLKRIYP